VHRNLPTGHGVAGAAKGGGHIVEQNVVHFARVELAVGCVAAVGELCVMKVTP
jgi:hypothetical protein